MAKAIKEIFGENATFDGLMLTVRTTDLAEIIEPGITKIDNATDADFVASLLIVALSKTTAPPVDSDGVPKIDKTQAVVAVNSINPSTSVERDGEKQVEHQFVFNVYTSDYQVFPIDRIV